MSLSKYINTLFNVKFIPISNGLKRSIKNNSKLGGQTSLGVTCTFRRVNRPIRLDEHGSIANRCVTVEILNLDVCQTDPASHNRKAHHTWTWVDLFDWILEVHFQWDHCHVQFEDWHLSIIHVLCNTPWLSDEYIASWCCR